MDADFGSDILKLAELLKPPEPEEDISEHTQGDLKRETINPYTPLKTCIEKNKEPCTIEEFVKQQENEVGTLGSKLQPVYEIKYRQAVGAEDVFLQIGAKTPATASCEDMVVIVHLPGEVFTALELSVTRTEVNLQGFAHKLDLTLPQPVNPDVSKAKWNQSDEMLTLTLRMVREFDFVNF